MINAGFSGMEEEGMCGKGIYFTNKLRFASFFSKQLSSGEKLFMVCLLALGNPYPVTEHPYTPSPSASPFSSSSSSSISRGGRPGYQSHFSLVHEKGKKKGEPVNNPEEEAAAQEYVVFEGAQILPLFLVFYRVDDPLNLETAETDLNEQQGSFPPNLA